MLKNFVKQNAVSMTGIVLSFVFWLSGKELSIKFPSSETIWHICWLFSCLLLVVSVWYAIWVSRQERAAKKKAAIEAREAEKKAASEVREAEKKKFREAIEADIRAIKDDISALKKQNQIHKDCILTLDRELEFEYMGSGLSSKPNGNGALPKCIESGNDDMKAL